MAGFQDAVGNISRGAQTFNKDPFLVGANAFVPLNSQLQYEKNLMGVWADADTQQGKINATNALNNFKAVEAGINTRKIAGADEAVRNQTLYMRNPDGTFRPIEEASLDAFGVTSNPYGRASLYQTAQQGALNTASREAFLNPENSVNSQQGYGVLQRGIEATDLGNGMFRVSNGTQVLGTFTRPELAMILSGTANTNKVGATQMSAGLFDHQAETRFNYDMKLNEQKNKWNAEIAQAGAEGKAAAAQTNAKVKALEGFQKFVTDNGLIAAASSGDQQALRQLVSFAAYTEQTYGLEPGTISSAFIAEPQGDTIQNNAEKVGAAFNQATQSTQPAPAAQPVSTGPGPIDYFNMNPDYNPLIWR